MNNVFSKLELVLILIFIFLENLLLIKLFNFHTVNESIPVGIISGIVNGIILGVITFYRKRGKK